jgi:hypothetical protein
VPITQTRMQNVLDESAALVAHIEQLRTDADNVERSELGPVAKFMLVMRLLYSPRPATPHSEQEREHFAKATARNVAQARRMRERRNRQQKETEHAVD